ncbi:hypothetical protein Acr_00g0050660 [Actinidia rufa]|uniref:Uncharacterized protein n=1 Tax=Actinidia rufa TaxID=165716 RepID=A0A7J0DKV2_9ERIC|nr:hypothetical protein Acr_00g0050660 [Actinidia rufa]
MPYKTEVGKIGNSLPSWLSEHLGESSMADEFIQHPPPKESSPHGRLPEDWSRDGSTSRQDRARIFPRGPPAMSRNGKRDFFSSWETIGSSIRAFLARKGPELVRVPWSWGAPCKQCNKVPILSKTHERFRQVFEKIREGGHFKILVVLNLKTFHKYFAPGQVEISSCSGGMAKSEIGVEAEGYIKGGAVASAVDASESSHSQDVSRPAVPSRDDSVEFIRIIGKKMRRILPHVPNLDLLRSQLNSKLSFELKSDAMSKRIKLSLLTKVVAEKTTFSSKGMVISEVPETASKGEVIPLNMVYH